MEQPRRFDLPRACMRTAVLVPAAHLREDGGVSACHARLREDGGASSAAHFRADPIHTRELRAYAVDEVKRTNGRVSFESAVRSQRRIEPEDEWPGSY